MADIVSDAGVPADKAEAFWAVIRENVSKRGDIAGWWTVLSEGAEPLIADEDREFVREAVALLPDGPFDGSTWKSWTDAVKEATGRKGKGLFMPLRKALTGRERGPEMADFVALMQKPPTID